MRKLRGLFVVSLFGLAMFALAGAQLAPVPTAVVEPAMPMVAVAAQPTATPRPTFTPDAVISRVSRATPVPQFRARRIDPDRPHIPVVDFAYDPPEIRIRPGVRVTWTNDGVEGHDVTGYGGEAWGSGAMGPTATYSRVFSEPGRFDYFCTIHPEMRGTIFVEP